MIRTLLITEPRGIEQEIKSLGEIVDFENNGSEKEVKTKLDKIEYDYQTIRKDIDFLLDQGMKSEHARRVAFLYTYGRKDNVPLYESDEGEKILNNLQNFLDRCEKELGGADKEIWKYNVINAKSPTPSTLLDVWQTTKRFFEKDAVEVIREKCSIFQRIGLKLKEPIPKNARGTYKSELAGKKAEVLFAGDKDHADIIVPRKDIGVFEKLLENQKEEILTITDKSYPGDDKTFRVLKSKLSGKYAPFRIITTSPYIFMAIVPADQTLNISTAIYRKYQQQLGKATGRLPFSVGNIFFKRRMPMFIVLDSARKMLSNFLDLAGKAKILTVCRSENLDDLSVNKQQHFIEVEPQSTKKRIEFRIPVTLGNKEKDYHHAYTMIANDSSRYKNR